MTAYASNQLNVNRAQSPANGQMIAEGGTLKVSLLNPWNIAYRKLDVPYGKWALIMMPDSTFRVRKWGKGQKVRLPLGEFEVFFVDAQKRATGPMVISAKSTDHWNVNLTVEMRYLVENPVWLLQVSEPEKYILDACRVAVADVIHTKLHDELVASPDKEPIDSITLGLEALRRLRGRLPEGVKVDKIDVLDRQGDTLITDLYHQRNVETVRHQAKRDVETVRYQAERAVNTERIKNESAEVEQKIPLATLHKELVLEEAQQQRVDVEKAKIEAEAAQHLGPAVQQDIEFEAKRKKVDQDYQVKVETLKQWGGIWEGFANFVAQAMNTPGAFVGSNGGSFESVLHAFTQGASNIPTMEGNDKKPSFSSDNGHPNGHEDGHENERSKSSIDIAMTELEALLKDSRVNQGGIQPVVGENKWDVRVVGHNYWLWVQIGPNYPTQKPLRIMLGKDKTAYAQWERENIVWQEGNGLKEIFERVVEPYLRQQKTKA